MTTLYDTQMDLTGIIAPQCVKVNKTLELPIMQKFIGFIRVCAILAAVTAPVVLTLWFSWGTDLKAMVERMHYVAPMVFFVPLLLFVRLSKPDTIRAELFLIDAAVVFLAATRVFISLIPFSGHMLLLTYAVLTERSRWFRVIAVIMLIHTTIFKFVVWGDFLTWSVGLIGGWIGARLYSKFLNEGLVLQAESCSVPQEGD